jgi:hypothetical protein
VDVEPRVGPSSGLVVEAQEQVLAVWHGDRQHPPVEQPGAGCEPALRAADPQPVAAEQPFVLGRVPMDRVPLRHACPPRPLVWVSGRSLRSEKRERHDQDAVRTPIGDPAGRHHHGRRATVTEPLTQPQQVPDVPVGHLG